ncbi:hypothetical protein FIBSPDRAFT_877375 [Athelia psychrophila]|uniref:Uncharacterized protein n=1 Tax=Athelia psychrophila TaxID=1759441 RepID=A0A167W1W3_9AGAM|nr:hypothetical protein FIBSPDRAFT_877375 [Fibularhizoctonia sp. CBS 109695]
MQLPQAATKILTELLERNGYRDPPRAEKEGALNKIHTFPGCENYTLSKLSGWLYRRRAKPEPAAPVIPTTITPDIDLLLNALFHYSPPSTATINLWDDVGTWLRNKRATTLPQPAAMSTGSQGSEPRPRAPARKEVPPNVLTPAVLASVAYSRDWPYQPFAAPSSMSSSPVPNLAVKREMLSPPFQHNIPSLVHVQESRHRVDERLTRESGKAIQRMPSGSHDQQLRPRTPIRQPSPRPAPYTMPLPRPPRIQRLQWQQQQRQYYQWQHTETPMSMSMVDAGPSTQPLKFFTRDAGVPMEGRPRTARRRDPEPMSPVSSVSPKPSHRSASPSLSAG